MRSDPAAGTNAIVARAGEPVVRVALRQAMRVMAEQFVMGRTIGEALARAGRRRTRAYRYSFDMLGEAALTAADAARYHAAYADAIAAIGRASRGAKRPVFAQPSDLGQAVGAASALRIPAARRVLAELVPSLARSAANRRRTTASA